ncbi:2-oxoacid:acceptor oxidoreductase subunit alpha [Roseospira marina]|uniref:2-oxoacid:acceptor oxidoreductase subunit alpha n=1 Tax=Roseospira marina TaxID=140057 RepID=A0A5M6IF79_9PROT|nr:2-oxoacid:acceptor oxidoreductase subunit alpha [Roseospira marina]KAA5606893.1 2-oxoacid:acceptor oxidoreductase subunit alpha [Roseospira marina]MBB4312936.1 2-oxoglutarate ferredoxin oxidoreductase subunit alpha [Roseospira marina]MBB5086291.1 2-oxoglutarate ferredoxin oxidoreductase subunit alpha [Roseospira marina]
MALTSVSIALTGSGGAGVMTAGQILLDAAAKAGYHGLMGRTLGPQIRGGESAALLRLATRSVQSPDDGYDILVAFDWGNIERFRDELPINPGGLIVADPHAGPVPDIMLTSQPHVAAVPFFDLAKKVPGGRVNMVALGLVATLIGLDHEYLMERLAIQLHGKGEAALEASRAALDAGAAAAEGLEHVPRLHAATPPTTERWSITGNDAAGVGAIQGGVRFCAAYPITPATDILEWLAPNLPKVGGSLVQCEDELASINMIIGSSFGGVPSLTATSGPGLALMMESLGLAVASETPVVVVDVQRGGPSTGIPTKSEQVDLNIAVNGLHGDAPHIVTAPLSIADCLFTTQWSVHLAEAMQTCVIVLSDQMLGQSRTIIDKPAELAFVGRRKVAEATNAAEAVPYRRYALTADGVSPMALPGTEGGAYTADGLEHDEFGHPSTQTTHHTDQLEKRRRKIESFDYGDHWALVDGDGDADVAIITWGSTAEVAREAMARAREQGVSVRLIAVRLIDPLPVDQLSYALAGVSRVLVVEQNHEGQFLRHLRARMDLPGRVEALHRPGPLGLRPGEILNRILAR